MFHLSFLIIWVEKENCLWYDVNDNLALAKRIVIVNIDWRKKTWKNTV